MFLSILCSMKIERLLFLKFLNNLAFFDSYFWPFNKTHEKIIAICVISAVMASIWNIFIKFCWHDEKLTFGSNFMRNDKLNQFWFMIWFTICVIYFKTPQLVERHYFGWSLVTGMNTFRKTAIIEFTFVCLYFLVRKEPFGVYMKNGLLPQKGQLLLVAKFCSF